MAKNHRHLPDITGYEVRHGLPEGKALDPICSCGGKKELIFTPNASGRGVSAELICTKCRDVNGHKN